ncbi:hypothetical protein BDV33DRAFT_20176 [Aspergillus novoparasiticus]|uniref:Uncharacterized protein n=1 Tax=Aspergillus novoparasiticus TaxID=986946 RepID=A0A5N6ECU9_9EURO|nr:hypothetical protein BDV33DRAFT_20176 [Aspergillus novoparasiticus]
MGGIRSLFWAFGEFSIFFFLFPCRFFFVQQLKPFVFFPLPSSSSRPFFFFPHSTERTNRPYRPSLPGPLPLALVPRSPCLMQLRL